MDNEPTAEKNLRQKKEFGARNLLILGIVSVSIAIITTAVSLVIYHNSGDIYLDRSRPGFLPDETETRPKIDDYTFSSSGQLTVENIEEYTKYYKENIEMIDDLANPFSEAPLSDKALGIPEEN